MLTITSVKAQTVKNVTAEEFKNLITKKNTVLIDLRTPAEIAKKGKIKGASEIDYFAKNSEKEILKLDKNKIYLIYCAGGGRSGECATLMKNNSFKNIYNLEKGFDDWVKKGFEIEKK